MEYQRAQKRLRCVFFIVAHMRVVRKFGDLTRKTTTFKKSGKKINLQKSG